MIHHISIKLPWPPSGLSPNARLFWRERVAIKGKYGQQCWVAATAQRAPKIALSDGQTLSVAISFCPPDKRGRDMDNMIGAFKAGQDAVARVIDVDDKHWAPTYKRLPANPKDPHVLVEFDIAQVELRGVVE